MKKRLFTLLLAVLMLVTCMPLTAMAEEKKDESIIYYDDFEGEKFIGVLNNNVSAATTDEEYYDGARSLKVTGYSRTYDMGPEYSLLNKAKQGHTYEVSFWAKVPEGNDPMTLRLKMACTRNGTTSYPNIVGDREINGDGWTFFKGSYTFTMPLEEVTGINLYIETKEEYLGSPYFIDEYLVKDTLAAEPEQPEDDREFVQVPPNLLGTQRGEAVEFLTALGICDYSGKDEFSFENTMTRADFGAILEKFYAEDAIVNNFKTVDSGKAVTYNDATRGLVNVLGYDLIVKNSNGRNYYAMAAEIGLLEGLSVKATDEATVANILLMLYNMSEISPLRPEIVGNPSRYGVSREKTVYSEYYQMYKATGVVNDTTYSGLAEEGKYTQNYVEIGNQLYMVGNTKPEELLGLNVTYYYVENMKDATKTLVCIAPYKNEVVTIDSADIISYANGEYRYYDERNREEKIKISVASSIIYNGQYKGTLTPNELCPDDGSVTFIDANRDGVYETIKIDDVKYITIDRVDIYKTTFYGKNKEVIEFDPYDSDTVFDIRDASGNIVKLSAIANGDLLAIRESKGANRHLISVKVIKEAVEGTVSTMMIADKNSSYIVIDEQTYSLTNGLVTALLNKTAETPTVGTVVRILLAENGKIAAIKMVGLNEIQYAYVINAKMGTKAFDKNLMLKVLKPDGEIAEFKAADKITVDGTPVSGDSLIVQNSFCPGGTAINQLIGYRANEAGQLLMVDTPYIDTANESSVSLKEIYNTGSSTAEYYTRAGRVFGTMKNIVSPDAVVYFVPTTDVNDEYLYEVGDVTWLSSGTSYTAVGYSIKGIDYVSDLIIIKRDSDRALSTSSNLMLVNEITQVINDEGELRTQITGLVKNSETSILVEDRSTSNALNTVKPGDMIRYRVGVNNEVIIKDALKNFKRIVELDSYKKPSLLATSTTYSGLYWGVGTVLEFKDGYMQVKLSTGTILNLDPTQFNISKYNKERGVYESSIPGAIVDQATNPEHPTTVFVRMRQRYAEEIVIFE